MRVRLKIENGAVIVCNSEWMERGAELADPRDLEALARERERPPRQVDED